MLRAFENEQQGEKPHVKSAFHNDIKRKRLRFVRNYIFPLISEKTKIQNTHTKFFFGYIKLSLECKEGFNYGFCQLFENHLQ